jgi:hypothetical protein
MTIGNAVAPTVSLSKQIPMWPIYQGHLGIHDTNRFNLYLWDKGKGTAILSIVTHTIIALSITTLSVNGLFVKLSMNGIQHK